MSSTAARRSRSMATGMPPSNAIVDLGRGRRGRRGDGPFVGVVGRGRPRILEYAGLAGATPEVDVDRVRRRLRDGDLDPALLGVVDLLITRQAHPDPHRGDDLEPRIEGVDGDVEADLVVALAGAAVGDRVGALALGDLDEELGDERPGEGRRQRVDALVEGVGLEMGPDEVRGEAVPGVDDVRARGAGRHGPTLDTLAERAATDVDCQRHHLDVVSLAQPGHGDRRVEPTRVGEDDLVHRWTSWARRVA